jgi:Pregnancy-associated plasma protein-A
VGKKLVGVLVLAAALTLSFTVSPAGAGGHEHASATGVSFDTCDGQANVFNSLDRLAESSTARGGDVAREPAFANEATEIGPQKGRGKGFSASIPTWFHIVHHADGTGNVTNKAVRDQLQVLNMTFGGFEGGVNTGFSFTLAGITRTANTEWYLAGPTTSGERAMKRTLHRGGDNTMNVYLTTAGVYLGWAYFPNVTENATDYLDGIVVDWESMLGTSTRYAGRYDQGETATHEAGHWLNLHHTFNGGCNNWGDYVADTPPQRVPTNGCPIGQDTCPEPGLDPIHNYMDYSYDTCYTEFTQGQALRAQDAWLEWRAS